MGDAGELLVKRSDLADFFGVIGGGFIVAALFAILVAFCWSRADECERAGGAWIGPYYGCVARVRP